MHKPVAVLALCGIIFALFIALDGVYQPAVLGVKSDKALAMRVKEWEPEGKIYSYGPHLYGVNFYNENRMAFFDKKMPEEGLLLVGQRFEEELQRKYGTLYEFTEIYRSGRRSCDIRDIVIAYRFQKK